MWTICDDHEAWDAAVARVAAHPLQSAWWGAARQKADRIEQVLLSHASGSLARVEVRRRMGVKAAWVPRGPAYAAGADVHEESDLLAGKLRSLGFSVWFSNEYIPARPADRRTSRTIWLDLSRGRERLWDGLAANWRYAVRRAARDGVALRHTSAPDDVTRFFRACESVSELKRFALPGSEALLQELISRTGSATALVGGRLHLAEINGEFAAGAVVAHSGPHLHYLWGATDRRFGRHGAGEALHWKIIEDALAAGCTRYDLEGIDPEGNPGTYDFKKRMGGDVIALRGVRGQALTLTGSLALKMSPWRNSGAA